VLNILVKAAKVLIACSDGAGDLKSVCETTAKLVKLGIVLAAYEVRKMKLPVQPLDCQNRCLMIY
jgi:hypothetical protein